MPWLITDQYCVRCSSRRCRAVVTGAAASCARANAAACRLARRSTLSCWRAAASRPIWLDESYPYVELFTGDSVPEPQRRRRGLGVEPMTAPPNAFQSGTDLIRLEPGAATSASWGLLALR